MVERFNENVDKNCSVAFRICLLSLFFLHFFSSFALFVQTKWLTCELWITNKLNGNRLSLTIDDLVAFTSEKSITSSAVPISVVYISIANNRTIASDCYEYSRYRMEVEEKQQHFEWCLFSHFLSFFPKKKKNTQSWH